MIDIFHCRVYLSGIDIFDQNIVVVKFHFLYNLYGKYFLYMFKLLVIVKWGEKFGFTFLTFHLLLDI